MKINYHILGLEITMCNFLPMQELNSFKKLPAEIGNHGRRQCTALVERCLIWHGNNDVGLSGDNPGERDDMIVGSLSLMQVCKQLDLICTCFIDTFQYNLSLRSVGICDVLVLRMGQTLGPADVSPECTYYS